MPVEKYYEVLQCTTPVLQQSTTPILLCTTIKYYSSTTPYCKVLLQYYPVLQSTNTTLFYKVFQRTTNYYSSTTLYYNVLLSTTKYNSSTTLSYKVALMFDLWHIWNVIYNTRNNQRHPPTSPNTAPAAKMSLRIDLAQHMKRHLQCAEQPKAASTFTKYCACHAKCISWLIRLTYETSFTISRASKVTLQTHQVLRLPRKMNLIIHRPHIWNVI